MNFNNCRFFLPSQILANILMLKGVEDRKTNSFHLSLARNGTLRNPNLQEPS